MFNMSSPDRIELIIILALRDHLSHPPPLSSSPVTSCSNIGKTDQNPPLVVCQSRQCPQGIPQQGRNGSDRPGSILNRVGSCWPLRMSLLWLSQNQLPPLAALHSSSLLCFSLCLTPFHLSMILFYFYLSPHLFTPFFHFLSFLTFSTFLACRLTF